jgi:hypothetical protein
MATRWREGQGCDLAAKRKVIEYGSAGDVCEDCATVLVYREKEVSSGV